MRKSILIVLLALVFIASGVLTACGGTTATTTAPVVTTAPPVTTGAPVVTTAAPIVLRVATTTPSTAPPGRSLTIAVDEIAKKSGGRIKPIYYYASSLMAAAEIQRSMAAGLGDIADYWTIDTGVQTVLYMFSMPGIAWPSPEKSTAIIYKILDTYKTEMAGEYDGIKLLWGASSGLNGHLCTTKKLVKSLEDLKGVKVGTSGASAQWFTSMGASAIFVAYEDTFMSMNNGLVEAYGGAGGWFKGAGAQDLVKYRTDYGAITAQSFYSIVANQKKFDSLPPDIQKMFTDYQATWVTMRHEIEAADHVAMIKYWTDKGVAMYTLPTAELKRWTDAAKPIHQAYIDQQSKLTGKPLQKIYDDLIAQNNAALAAK